MKTILFDANFLLLPGNFKIDIFTESEALLPLADFATLDRVVGELEKIAQSAEKGKDKEAAKIGLQLLDNKGIKVIKTETLKNTDDIIVEIAKSGDFVVATQDKALKGKLKVLGIPVIFLRQKNRLILE